MKKPIITLLATAALVANFTVSTYAQAPDAVWSQVYQANSSALSLYEMPDSGFVLGGYIVPEGESYRDMFIVRTDAVGDTIWTSAIGASDRGESANCLYPTADGGFILTGSRAQDEPYTYNSDVYLVKADQDGNAEWGAAFGAEDVSESGNAVVQTADGGYLIAGCFWNSSTVYDTWFLWTNNLGVLSSQDQLTWPDADYPYSLITTTGSGFALTGRTQSFDAEYDYDMFIYRMDQNGSAVWSYPYGSGQPYDESANHICQTSDGGFLLCGFRQESGSGKDIYVVKTDNSGSVEWTSQLGGTYHDEARCCIETADGGYAVSASWYIDGNWKTALIKYNADGDTLWTAFWGDPANGHTPYGLVQTSDYGYAVGGLMSGGAMAAYLVKFDTDPDMDPYTFRASELAVPVDNSAQFADTITVSFTPEELAGLDLVGIRVMIDTLEHPAVEELTVSLEHEGTEVVLFAAGDASGTDFAGTAFTDASEKYLPGGQAPYTGVYRPKENLGAFAHLDINGDWIVKITDGTSGNDGTLRSWGFTLLTDYLLDTEDDTDNGLPSQYHLSYNYPNPFNPATTISYRLPRRSEVTIDVFNILGRQVTTLVDETMPAGEHRVIWNGNDADAKRVTSGVYFYRFRAGEYTETRKMILLK